MKNVPMDDLAILVIDDNVDDLEAISRALSKSKLFDNQVLLCEFPDEGLNIVKIQALLCVFIDFHFPTQTGLSLLQDIKNINPHLPVIVLTGMADEALAVQLLKAGAYNYLTKNNLQVETLNSAISDAIASVNKKQAPSYSSQEVLNLLIVDDNSDDREYLRRLLQKNGMRHQISECESGEQLHHFNLHEVHCVLLDYSLPGESGLGILKRLKSICPYLAVIVITGQGDERIAVEAIKSGAENYMVKGKISADYLEKSISDACEKSSLRQRLDQKEEALKRSESSLDDANKFQSLIFQSLPDYIFIKDSNFRIVKANQPFLSLYPAEMRDKVIGYTTLESYNDEDVETFLTMDKKAFKTGLSETFETINFPSGEQRTLFTTKKRFTDNQGQQFILGVARDVTERESLIKRLKKSNSDLEQFAYIASHDLKSPLQGILKVVAWIKEDIGEDINSGLSEKLQLIDTRTFRMSQLLDDLLAYSRLEKKLQDYEWFPLEDIQEQMLELVEGISGFQFEMPEGDVFLPKVAFEIVILNLVSNAIKHHTGKNGKIKVTLEEQDKTYCFTVSDDGPGIGSQYSDKIFEMFQTLRSRDELEGSGMGLAVIRKIMGHYHGEVALAPESELGGATFTLSWPNLPINQVFE